MISKYIVLLTIGLLATQVYAAKPEHAENQKHEKKHQAVESKEHKSLAQTEMREKDNAVKNNKAKNQSQDDDVKTRAEGLEKQKAKKSEQEMKELDKGSEQGQEARQKRKKWWKFWE